MRSKINFMSTNSQTDEEILIEDVVKNLNSLKYSNSQEELVAKIKSDLLELKVRVSESDFTVRYLKNREKTLQQFIDQFPSMLGYWNNDLINIHSNKVYADYFGKAPSDIRGHSIKSLLGEKIFKMNYPHISRVLKGEPQSFEREIPTPKGIVHTLANYIPHFVEGKVVGFFVIVTDVSNNKKLEQRTKNLEISLYEQSRLSSLGQMASGIAHEINNPTTIIYSNACLLLKELNKIDFNKEYLIDRISEIEQTAKRIAKIVDGMRSIVQGSSQIDLEKNDIVKIVTQVISICKGRFSNFNFVINWQPPSHEIFVICNQVQVSEILLNILNNAFDALKNKQKGHVNINVIALNNECKISISNNGSEISKIEREKIFLPFYTTKGKEGTGLGLKISKDLAVANNGSLILADNPETEFVLTLNLSTD